MPAADPFAAWSAAHLPSRRTALGLAGAALTVPAASSQAQPAAPPAFAKLAERDLAHDYPNVHEGRGTISVRRFAFDGAPAPAHFLIYDIPPGASEGVHTHHLGDTRLGPYDEYYYVIEGRGEMQIDGRPVAVAPGDHIHTPLGVPHGIANTMAEGNLRVFLTFIAR